MSSENEITLGEFLRHERERRNITVEQVASVTKVGIRTLHALEENQYSELPAKPFIRGFVISYCRFIGLEPKEVLAQFDPYIHKKSSERPNREGGHSGYAFEKKDGDQQSRTILVIAMVSFVVVGGISMLILKPSLRHSKSSHIEKLRAAHPNEVITPSATVAKNQPPSEKDKEKDKDKKESDKAKDAGKAPQTSGATPAAVTPVLAPENKPESAQAQSTAEKPKETSDKPKEEKAVAEDETKEEESKKAKEEDSKDEDSGEEQDTPKVAGSNPKDPLDSGLELKGQAIKHKLNIKVTGDIWVRYQLDDRPMRRFIVRKGKTLVLRAEDVIRLQVSDPNSVQYSYNNGKMEKAASLDLHSVAGENTIIFPEGKKAEVGQPFSHSVPLEKIPPPKPQAKTDE